MKAVRHIQHILAPWRPARPPPPSTGCNLTDAIHRQKWKITEAWVAAFHLIQQIRVHLYWQMEIFVSTDLLTVQRFNIKLQKWKSLNSESSKSYNKKESVRSSPPARPGSCLHQTAGPDLGLHQLWKQEESRKKTLKQCGKCGSYVVRCQWAVFFRPFPAVD